MYPISDFMEYMFKRPEREFFVKCDVGNQEYSMANIVDFYIDSTLLQDDNFTIGTVVLSKLVIKLKLLGNIPSGTKISPYLAFNTDLMTWREAQFPWQDATMSWEGGPSEWMPLGEFYVDERKRVNDVWQFECFDKLIWSEKQYESQLTYPATMQAMWNEICTTLGYTYDGTVVLNSSYTVPSKPTGMTMRQVMGYIAGAHSASVRAGKDGQIQWKVFHAADGIDLKMTTADYVRVSETSDLKRITKLVIIYDDEQNLAYEVGTGTADTTLTVYNPFATSTIATHLYNKLNGFSYQPMEMDARGYPHVDVGDTIEYEMYEGTSWIDAIMPWDHANVAWDGITRYPTLVLSMVLQYKGGFKMTLDAPSSSSQQESYVVQGEITQQVQDLNQTTVKQNKSYYGVITGHENGLEVKRDDGVSELKLNSDVMDWKVQGQRVLYLDALAKELRFSGTLYGADGVFTGRLEAGEIVGSEIWGSIINGGQINGTSIYGSYISTSEGSFPKVEMSNANNLIRASGSASNYVELLSDPQNLGAPSMKFNFGAYSTQMYQITSSFYLYNPYGEIWLDAPAVRLSPNTRIGSHEPLGSLAVPASSATELLQLRSSFNVLIAYLKAMGVLE